MIKTILFDLDGVLVDACDWHYYSLNDALDFYKGFRISYKDHIDKFNGLPTSIKLKMLNIEGIEADEIWKMKQAQTLTNIRKFGNIDKYKIKMHKALIASGYNLGCVTNSIRETAEEMLMITGQIDFMSFVITNEDVVNNKPHPDCYLLALEKFKSNKNETLIIEDSPKGIQAAEASGCRVLKVNDIYDVTLDKIRKNL